MGQRAFLGKRHNIVTHTSGNRPAVAYKQGSLNVVDYNQELKLEKARKKLSLVSGYDNLPSDERKQIKTMLSRMTTEDLINVIENTVSMDSVEDIRAYFRHFDYLLK